MTNYAIAIIEGLHPLTVHRHTKGIQRINPETGQSFESKIEYNRYMASQEIIRRKSEEKE